MPPKAKFTKEEIISAGLDIVRKNGMDFLTARTLGDALKSSPRPIFTVFNSMEEVKTEVLTAARNIYNSYIKNALSGKNKFKCVGEQYILFSVREQKLFQLIFMTERAHKPQFSGILPLIDENYENILNSITDEYGINRNAALKLYNHLFVYTHGIAALCATDMCSFTSDEINKMISEIFVSLLIKAKNGDLL